MTGGSSGAHKHIDRAECTVLCSPGGMGPVLCLAAVVD